MMGAKTKLDTLTIAQAGRCLGVIPRQVTRYCEREKHRLHSDLDCDGNRTITVADLLSFVERTHPNHLREVERNLIRHNYGIGVVE